MNAKIGSSKIYKIIFFIDVGNTASTSNNSSAGGPPVKLEIKEESYEETEFKAEPLSDDDDLEDFLWQPDQDPGVNITPRNEKNAPFRFSIKDSIG